MAIYNKGDKCDQNGDTERLGPPGSACYGLDSTDYPITDHHCSLRMGVGSVS